MQLDTGAATGWRPRRPGAGDTGLVFDSGDRQVADRSHPPPGAWSNGGAWRHPVLPGGQVKNASLEEEETLTTT